MSHAFQKYPAKAAFGKVKEPNYASDFTRTKKSLNAYCIEKKDFNCKKSWTQGDYLLYNDAQNSVRGSCIPFFNTSNLASNLYTREYLPGFCLLQDSSGCSPKITPQVNATVPFYYRYVIDPRGLLFGVSPCGLNNYANYMTPELQGSKQ